MARARIVTVISHAMRAELIRWVGARAERVRVVHDCVGSEFRPSPKDFDQVEPLILQVGTATNKNLERVANALKSVRCRLEIIGDVDDHQRQVLNQAGVKYRALGIISDEDVLRAFHRCDMLVFASTYEGFGLPIVEAQAIGRPVVSSDFGAMAEIAGAGALLINPFDTESIRRAVLEVIQNEGLRARIMESGFSNVSRFRPHTIASAYVGIYEEAARDYLP
jgi:glycosyltransferase involved in cell wall biosynthesis